MDGIDPVLESLHLAIGTCRNLSTTEPSRELSLVITKIDEAILWRQRDKQVKNADNLKEITI